MTGGGAMRRAACRYLISGYVVSLKNQQQQPLLPQVQQPFISPRLP